MNVEDLKPDIQFRLIGERKFKTVTKVVEIKEHDDIEPIGRKILVLFYGCKQYSILKGQEVEIKCPHTHQNGSDAFKKNGVTHKEIFECEICGETTSA